MKLAMMLLLVPTFALIGFAIGFTLSENGKPKTNGDRIRAMSNVELAKFLMDTNECALRTTFCPKKSECQPDVTEGRCIRCMMEWLNMDYLEW